VVTLPDDAGPIPAGKYLSGRKWLPTPGPVLDWTGDSDWTQCHNRLGDRLFACLDAAMEQPGGWYWRNSEYTAGLWSPTAGVAFWLRQGD